LEKRILLVDDQVDITDALKMGLEIQGFQVDTFNDPEVALKSFKQGQYDVAIIDIRMPKMDGFDLYRRIRKIDRETRVAFLTAFEVYREEFEKKFPELNGDVLLKKPITIAKLSAKLNELILDHPVPLAYS
jgi:DNA-binding response OmpR family regulator